MHTTTDCNEAFEEAVAYELADLDKNDCFSADTEAAREEREAYRLRACELAHGQYAGIADMTADDDFSYGEIASFSHPAQVAIFGWCSCEDAQPMYDDCRIAG